MDLEILRLAAELATRHVTLQAHSISVSAAMCITFFSALHAAPPAHRKALHARQASREAVNACRIYATVAASLMATGALVNTAEAASTRELQGLSLIHISEPTRPY